MFDRRHVNQKPSRQSDVRSDARTFLGNRLLGDLHQDFLTFLQQVSDHRLVPFVPRGAAAATPGRCASLGRRFLISRRISGLISFGRWFRCRLDCLYLFMLFCGLFGSFTLMLIIAVGVIGLAVTFCPRGRTTASAAPATGRELFVRSRCRDTGFCVRHGFRSGFSAGFG
jgi:hypothetical protein